MWPQDHRQPCNTFHGRCCGPCSLFLPELQVLQQRDHRRIYVSWLWASKPVLTQEFDFQWLYVLLCSCWQFIHVSTCSDWLPAVQAHAHSHRCHWSPYLRINYCQRGNLPKVLSADYEQLKLRRNTCRSASFNLTHPIRVTKSLHNKS